MSHSPDHRLEDELVERFQRDFPIVRHPYAEIAGVLGVSEIEVTAALMRMLDQGKLSRIGAVVRPNAAGASTLAAMAVPPDRLEHVAALVSGETGVNHNYERENRINLWFVVHAADVASLEATLGKISQRSELPVYDFRLEKEFRIDLGFSLKGLRRAPAPPPAQSEAPSKADFALIAALDHGLGIEAEPFGRIAAEARMDIGTCLRRIRDLMQKGVIRRFGLVVRHRAFGYAQNAMVVWNIADAEVDRIGPVVAAQEGVNLCYRRRRGPADWPFNLYAMIHGKDRKAVEDRVDAISAIADLSKEPRAVLFSPRCFKQTGARREAVAAAAAA